MKTLLSTLILVLSLLFPLTGSAGTQFSESDCTTFGAIAAHYSEFYASKQPKETWDAIFPSEWLKTAPSDILTLHERLKEAVVKLNNELSPQDNFNGARNLCLTLEGDVEAMITQLESYLEYAKKVEATHSR
jgi:hypothetical protein